MDKFASYMLLSPSNGHRVPFQSVWPGGKTVVFFMRRFGCVVPRLTAKRLSRMVQQASANNVRLVGIGPERLGYEEFMQGNFLAGDVYVDESKELYNSIGFKRVGVFGLVYALMQGKLSSWTEKAHAAGVMGDMKGDIYQLGGVLVLDNTGKVLYQFVQQEATDEPNYADVAAAAGLSINYIDRTNVSDT